MSQKIDGSVSSIKCKEVDFGIDEAYYIYVIKLRHTEQEFWSSSYKKIDYILSTMAGQLQNNATQKSNTVTSMKEIPGW